MEFLVETTIVPPADIAAESLAEVRAAEAERARVLVGEGILVRIWRPADRGAEWKNVGIWAVSDRAELDSVLASLPMRPWMTSLVRGLEAHPSDPIGAES